MPGPACHYLEKTEPAMDESGKNRLLMVTFYYPPAGGVALPGSQRAVKFVRYLERHAVSVLTLDPQCYPGFVSHDFNRKLPIKGEKIFHTRCFDAFEVLLALRCGVRRVLGKSGDSHALPPPGAGAAAVAVAVAVAVAPVPT